MTEEDWNTGYAKSILVFLNGDAVPTSDPRGEKVRDDSFMMLFNAHHEGIRFTIPRGAWGNRWMRFLDSAEDIPRFYRAGGAVPVQARSFVLLRRVE
jgi:glycogen operon protein